MAKKNGNGKNGNYTIEVEGKAIAAFSGAVPKSIDELTLKPDKDVKSLIYEAAKAQIDACIRAGDIEGAWKAIKAYEERTFEFPSPLNTFKRDMQNADHPFIGAHCVVGAFRDAAKFLFPECFYRKKGDNAPAGKHLRKFVLVKPFHIFFYRDGEIIKDADAIEGQQPTPDVKGFAKYEVIYPPFDFRFNIHLYPKGPFEGLLSDRDKVLEVVNQAVIHGLGSRRSAGYGAWELANLTFKDGVAPTV